MLLLRGRETIKPNKSALVLIINNFDVCVGLLCPSGITDTTVSGKTDCNRNGACFYSGEVISRNVFISGEYTAGL